MNKKEKSKNEILKESILKIIDSGYKPGALKQGYVLRKLLKELIISGDKLDHSIFEQELKRQEQVIKTYNRLKNKHKDKSKEWWLASVGVDLDLL